MKLILTGPLQSGMSMRLRRLGDEPTSRRNEMICVAMPRCRAPCSSFRRFVVSSKKGLTEYEQKFIISPVSTPPLFSRPVGAYRRLDSFTLATIIQTETWRFCREFLDVRNDPKGRWFDQMTQAARSGRANIAEGSENSVTSKETELKLLGIARGSLAELLADYEMWIAFAGALPWSRKEAEEVHAMQLDAFPETSEEGLLRTSALHARTQRAKFASWLDSPDPCMRANCLMVLILRAMSLLRRQMEYLGEEFARNGGLREQMSATRRAVRDGIEALGALKAPTTSPPCPECGRPMRRRVKRATGEEFWGCTAFDQGCRGTRPIE